MAESTNPFSIGDLVVDRDGDTGNVAVVVNLPPQKADEWTAYRNTTVAEDNPEYPEDARIAVVVFRSGLVENDSEEYLDPSKPVPLDTLNDLGIHHYSFPVDRLDLVDPDDAPEIPEDDEQEESATTGETDDESEEEETSAETEPEATTEDTADETPIPSELEPVAEHLDDSDVAYEADGDALIVEKLGQTYTISNDRSVEGEGLFLDDLVELVAEAPEKNDDSE